MSAQQYKLELEMEPTLWESLGFDDMEDVLSWFDNAEYEQWRDEVRRDTYIAWSDCWQTALSILESRDNHSQLEVSLAESIFKLMCRCSVVPIVEGRFEGAIARNQLD
jgi:hypothetical protein